jgi:decaprenyl-phosphate phosphoribosyltransferase
MTIRPPATRATAQARPQTIAGRLGAVLRTARPRQWPKNLLVLAAPLAGASQGRDDGIGYALVAVAAFTAASSAVYFINDAADADRDRWHPVKRKRPVASGALPVSHARAIGILAAGAALAAAFWIGAPWLAAAIAAYLVVSLLYTVALKHVPVVEMACVASGFVLRALGGGAAVHIPLSGWFLTVCSLGALMVAVAKRRSELAALGPDAARHRPVMSWYGRRPLAVLARVLAAGMIVAYALWALSSADGARRAWNLASVFPLIVALIRFDQLSGRGTGRPIEDLIVRDRIMAAAELAWLAMFALGL